MYGAVTLCGSPFQSDSTSHRLCNSLEPLPRFQVGPTTPSQHRRQAVPLRRFGLFPFRSPLLRESLLLSLPRGTEMFQFPRFPPPALCVQAGVTGHDPSRVSPFGHPWIKAWSTAPHGFSQPPTSFIGIWRQGIHRWLFVAWDIRLCFSISNTTCFSDARARYAVLKGPVRRPGRHVTVTRAMSSGEGRSESARRGQTWPATLRLPQNGTVNDRLPRRPVVPARAPSELGGLDGVGS